MALNAIVDNVDSVPEGIRGEYKPITEGDHKGKFMLDVSAVNGFALDNVDGLRTAYQTTKSDLEGKLTHAQTELSTAQSALGGYGGLKLKPSEIATALKKLETLEKLDPNVEADKIANTKVEAFKTTAQKDFDSKLEAEKAKSGKYRGQIEHLIRDGALTGAIAKAEGNLDLLTPMLSARVKVVEDADGNLKTVVLDAAGNAAQTFRGTELVNMTVDDLVDTYKKNEAFGGAFKASGKSGSGSPHGEGGVPPANGAVTLTSKEWLAKTSAADHAGRIKLFAEARAGKYIVKD